MMPRKPLSSSRYGRLAVLEGVAGGWLCQCDCGSRIVVTGSHLRSGAVKSCGCFQLEHARLPRKHGKSGSRVYVAWRAMMQRCFDRHHSSFYGYGARGITVCDQWRDFRNFYADMGEPPAGHSLDRKDSNGNYEPSNCRWASRIQQSRNRRGVILITIGGETRCLAEWCEVTGKAYHTAYSQFRNGDAPEEIFAR